MERVLILTTDENNSEMNSLLRTLGISVVRQFLQKRRFPHKVGFLGPGKLDEIEDEIKSLEFDAIVVNGILKPSQHHYLEMRFQKECIDRTGIILRIFAEHAHTPEAIAQVTLAKLRYEQPFLREWIHKAKRGDRPGFLAGGEYATDVYFEHAKSQARRIELDLQELSKQREITRSKRHSKGFSLVSLAGYTNAGKSALFNALCNADVGVDDKLFSTLSTTTRRISEAQNNILMVDTVGFIRDLPADLIEAFNSTLEEIFYADLILLVFDGADSLDLVREKLRASTDILLPKIQEQMLVYVANKVDLLSSRERVRLESACVDLVKPHTFEMVSAKTGEGLDSLRQTIALIQRRTCMIDAKLPLTNESYSLLSSLRSSCTIVQYVRGKGIVVSLKCKPEEAQKISGWLAKAGAIEISIHPETALPNGAQAAEVFSGNEGAPLD
jgi:GTP-binding protein HflX